MTERPIPGLLADLIHYAKRVREIYARCGSAGALAGNDMAQEAILWNLIAMDSATSSRTGTMRSCGIGSSR